VIKINILAIFNNILAIFQFYWRISNYIGENPILLANFKIYRRIPSHWPIQSEKGGFWAALHRSKLNKSGYLPHTAKSQYRELSASITVLASFQLL